jgi:glutamate dehydrogenase (NADP+)/cyclic pyranopterin phosphate synthase/molybdopterin-guanine dinucleotide biosynthesis protein A
MKVITKKTSGAIRACLLIGGRSSRMGHPKHLIRGKNGQTWVEHTVELLSPFVDEVVLSGKGDVPDTVSHLHRIPDLPEVAGPLTGILSAMRWQPDSCWLLIACDMPDITKEALAWLLDSRCSYSDGTVPRLHDDGFVEPLLALYEPEARVYFEELAASQIFRISMVARQEKIITPVVPQHLTESWRNINTPEQLDKARF